MKNIIYKIWNFFDPPQPKFGPKIFECRSWLDKQVDEGLRKNYNEKPLF